MILSSALAFGLGGWDTCAFRVYYCVDAISRSLFLCLGVRKMWYMVTRGAVTLWEKSLAQHPRAAPALLTPVLFSLLLPSENAH